MTARRFPWQRAVAIALVLCAWAPFKLAWELGLERQQNQLRYRGVTMTRQLRDQLTQGLTIGVLAGMRNIVADFVWLEVTVAWEKYEWFKMLHDEPSVTEPEIVAAETSDEAAFAPLPSVTMGEVIGLVSMLGPQSESLFALSTRLKKDFTTFLSVVKAAELIDLVETPGQTVHLTKPGLAFRNADPKARKKIMHDLLLCLKIFQHFDERIGASENKEITEEEALEDLARFLPTERPKVLFKHLVGWARYAELFSFDARRAVLKRFEKEYLGKPPASRLKEASA